MALNLLDSLSSTAAAPGKNSFSLKNTDALDGASTDFGQLLGGLMNPAQLKGLENTEQATETAGDKETVPGQKIATESTDALNPDGSAALLAMTLPTAAPVQQNLTALVLSPHMTAITPSQPAPDAGSLIAFAKSQGLDEDVAAWLVAAGKGTAAAQVGATSRAGNTSETTDLDATSVASAAVAISLLASPAPAAKLPATTTPVETTPPIQLMPMATPAAWLTPRASMTGKTATTAPSQPQADSSKNTEHTSDLDLSLIFGTGKDPVKTAPTPDASFTPAAWVMAGVTPNSAQTASTLTASSLVKWLADDQSTDDNSPPVDGVNSVSTERSPGKLSDPLASASTSNTKGIEAGLSTAERSELHQAQAEKMGQAIGQRMLSEMEKGHWHLKMMLKPANLGNIEVEMRLRNGELDANFTASQSATRDLLQDGLPKLKDTLTQMGMDVASMNIGGGSSQKNGGDSTPQRAPSLSTAAQTEHQEEQAVMTGKPITSSGQDGLDVLV